MKQKAPQKRGLHGLRLEGLMDSERKMILKLTVLNLCDLLNDDQIEELIALGEHLLDAEHSQAQAKTHCL